MCVCVWVFVYYVYKSYYVILPLNGLCACPVFFSFVSLLKIFWMNLIKQETNFKELLMSYNWFTVYLHSLC